jgi:hypothetical protein
MHGDMCGTSHVSERVPESTRSTDIKLNERVSLRRRPRALSLPNRTFPKSGPTVAKRSGDHIPPGGFVFKKGLRAVLSFDRRP